MMQIDSTNHQPSERPTRDEIGIRLATIYASRGTCLRAQVGAVIQRDGRSISSGYVGAPVGTSHCTDVGCEPGADGGCQRTIHAEANAIAYAARYGASTEAATIYTTHAPCYNCAKLIVNAGISRVVYDAEYRLPQGVELLRAAGIEVTRAS